MKKLIITYMYDTFRKVVNHVQLGSYNCPYEMEYSPFPPSPKASEVQALTTPPPYTGL